MKVLAVIFFVASVSAIGSGPYLPSGWRPSGPAFYLPTEVQKPVAVPLKDAPIQEKSESGLLKDFETQLQEELQSGSDALREYGPPKLEVAQFARVGEISKEVSQDITQQGLPDAITEQAFAAIEAKFTEDEGSTSDDIREVTSEKVVVETTTDTESTVENQTESPIQGKSLEIESQTESNIVLESGEVTEKVAEEKVVVKEGTKSVEVNEVTQADSFAAVTVEVEKKLEEAEVKAVEGVNNIAEALVKLENEIKSQKSETVEEIAEVKGVQQSAGSVAQTPIGFLEYGPPSFTEYGPPKGDLRTDTQESNEVRRRRFSPKFRSSKKISKSRH